jgi:hypothetical protein
MFAVSTKPPRKTEVKNTGEKQSQVRVMGIKLTGSTPAKEQLIKNHPFIDEYDPPTEPIVRHPMVTVDENDDDETLAFPLVRRRKKSKVIVDPTVDVEERTSPSETLRDGFLQPASGACVPSKTHENLNERVFYISEEQFDEMQRYPKRMCEMGQRLAIRFKQVTKYVYLDKDTGIYKDVAVWHPNPSQTLIADR